MKRRVRRAFLGLVRNLAKTPISSRLLQRLVSVSLLLIILFYRLFLSRWMGRVCLFHESCSAFTLASLQGKSSLHESMRVVSDRLSDCNGNYSLLIDAKTWGLSMKAESGRVYEDGAISSALKENINGFRLNVLAPGGSLPFDPKHFLSQEADKAT